MTRLFQMVILLFLMTSCQTSNKKTDLLRDKIEQFVSDKDAVVGVSIIADIAKATYDFYTITNR
jgi:beta-lactamase class A/beta-lactamase class A VEB